MNNLNKKTKHSTKSSKQTQQKVKTIRNSAVKTPKNLNYTSERRSPQLHKFKSVPIKSKRHMTTSLLPDLHFQETEPQIPYQPSKTNKTNTTAVDFPYSNSQKTLNFQSTDKICKSIYRPDKAIKKPKTKTYKYDLHFKTSENQALTTRKSSAKKITLDSLMQKTDRILKKYQKREQVWHKERVTLIQEIQELKKKKNSGRILTSSASSYMQKKLIA